MTNLERNHFELVIGSVAYLVVAGIVYGLYKLGAWLIAWLAG